MTTDAPPRFTKLLESQSVSESETVTLECRLTGHPKPIVNWYKIQAGHSDEPPALIKDTADYIYLEEDKNVYKLVIREASVRDAGIYRAVATNKCGQAVSNCRLNVSEELTDQDITIIDTIECENENKSDNTDNDVFDEEEYLHISEGDLSPPSSPGKKRLEIVERAGKLTSKKVKKTVYEPSLSSSESSLIFIQDLFLKNNTFGFEFYLKLFLLNK